LDSLTAQDKQRTQEQPSQEKKVMDHPATHLRIKGMLNFWMGSFF